MSLPLYLAEDFIFSSTPLKGKKPLSASILVQKYLRPAAIKAGVLEEGQEGTFRIPQLSSFPGACPCEDESRSEDRAGIPTPSACHPTLQLYAQSDMESKLEARGRFLEQLPGDKIHLLTEQVQWLSWVESWVEEFRRNRISPLQ